MKVLERNDDNSVVEVEVTTIVKTTIREGRDVPDMEYSDLSDSVDAGQWCRIDDLTVAIHKALEQDPVFAAELRRILD